MEPYRRYSNSSKIYGKLSRYQNIFVINVGEVYVVQKIQPKNGAFIAYNPSTKGFLSSLEKIIDRNMYHSSVCPNIDLERSLDFILKARADVDLLPMFTEVFPSYRFVSQPAIMDIGQIAPETRNEEVEFLFPRVFVGQEIFLGEKLRLITKLSSSEFTDVEFFGGRKMKKLTETRDAIVKLKAKLNSLKEDQSQIDIEFEKAIDEMMENSKLLQLEIVQVEDKKMKLNEEFEAQKAKISDKWEKIYQEYTQRRLRKISQIEDEISVATEEDAKELEKRKVKLQAQIEKGHAKNNHAKQIEELDELMKKKMSELDDLLDLESGDIIDISNSLNRKIESLQIKKSENEEEISSVISKLEELELEKENLSSAIETDREKFMNI